MNDINDTTPQAPDPNTLKSGQKIQYWRWGALASLLVAIVCILFTFQDATPTGEDLALKYYEQPDFAPLPDVPESESAAILRSAFIQQRWESAHFDISRMAADAPYTTEARYIEAHISFMQKKYAQAYTQFDHIIQCKDTWYSPRAIWYQSLSALACGETARAKTRLRIIAAASEHPFHQKAKSLYLQMK